MRTTRRWQLSISLFVVLACGHPPAPALSQAPPSADASLQKLVAPIALYPDALVAQILPASTQPAQVVEAARAIANGVRPDDATASQWNPSIQALLSFPTVLKMMNDKIGWTSQLGQAVIANQGAVMAAIQDVRRQAQTAGNLKSNAQQVVQTQGSTIIIEPASPQYIYVPQYNPVAILQPVPYYAYAPLMTFGIGFAAGAATAYACDWGHYGSYGSVTINNNYHYNYSNNYASYHTYNASTGSYSAYHPQSNTYTGYNAKTGSTGAYNANTGSHGAYHGESGTYSGYNAKTGTYGAYNPATGKYGTYDPSTGAYNKNGQTGTYHPPSSTSSEYHPTSTSSSGYHPTSTSSSGWGGQGHSGWGSEGGSGGDAFHGLGGGGWGAQEASNRGASSAGDRSFGGGGGGFDRGGWGGGGGFRGGGFRGRR
jgi:hypothetical protein